MSLFGSSNQPSTGGGFAFGTPSTSATAFGFGTSQTGNTAGKVFGLTNPSFGGFGAATTTSTGSVFGTSFGVKTTASSTFGRVCHYWPQRKLLMRLIRILQGPILIGFGTTTSVAPSLGGGLSTGFGATGGLGGSTFGQQPTAVVTGTVL